MKEVKGNLWTYPADWRVITTNGVVRRDGGCVMGRGVAFQAAQKFPALPFKLGAKLLEAGNILFLFNEERIITLPVKRHWQVPASLPLIERGLKALQAMPPSTVANAVLPMPGCGNGGLQWEDVQGMCKRILDDRFMVITTLEIK